MNRLVFRVSVCVLGLLLTAGCGNNDTAKFTAAADALSARLSGGTAPAADDPAVRAFEAQAASALNTLGTSALPVHGFDSYDSLCGKTVKIVAAWVNLGVNPAADVNSKVNQINANAERYIDRMFTPLLFSAHCTAAHMPFIEKEASSSDMSSKKEALQQIRDGAFGQVNGLLQMASSTDIDAPRRGRIVDLLASDAANFAIALNQRQRAAVSAMADTLPADARAKGASIKNGLSAAACGKLCSM